MDLRGEESLRIGPAGASETQGRESAAGLALSAVLHGLVLIVLLTVGVFGSEGPERIGSLRGDRALGISSAAAPAQQKRGQSPQSNVAQPQSAPSPDGVATVTEPSRTDELQAKLEALAKLREPEAVTPSKENGAARPESVASGDDIVSGPQGPFSVKDYIRSQIERRWNFDLAALGPKQVSIPIHVEITKAGVVRKAESSTSPPPTIRFIARSPSVPATQCCCRRRFRCRPAITRT